MKVRISIRGRPYTLQTDRDEDLHAIASYVDEQMADVAERSPRLDEYSVALLAALNIASELDRLRREVDEELATVDHVLASAAVLLASADRGKDRKA